MTAVIASPERAKQSLKQGEVFMDRKMTLLFVGLVSISLIVTGCGKKEEKKEEIVRPVKSVLVQGPQEYVRNYPGKTQASQRVEMSFRRVSGPLVELPIKEGDRVAKDQLIAKIDPRDYRIQYEESKAEYDKAESDYKRYLSLYEEDAVPLADLELYRAKRDVAKARLEDATASISDTELKAPFEGIIGERYVENFEKVKAQEPIVSLHDISQMEIVVDLPEGLVAVMGKQDDSYALSATFQEAPGKEYPLEVKEFAARADATTQTYRATLIMPQPEEILVLPGMSASVKTRMKPGAESKQVVIAIPSSSVFTGEDGKDKVWVVNPDDDTVQMRDVEVGGLFGVGKIRIESGITTGERVVTAGANSLREGMKVKLLDETSSKILD